ncbi:hypothetical protein HPP92_003903 [Vanilla planifolia]|uniref:Uncharacterized protein n=1 Tax=Vanilla planifolia TaxID=51239 RepID=A0A835S827_VANPL|nr:hypothetical protein HPP92_003903 [Vanilla planifolia]
MAGQALSTQGNRFIQYGWCGIPQPIQPKNISTYMAEFECGFPSDGLSSVALKWWGNGDGKASVTPPPPPQSADDKQEELEPAVGSNIENDPSASLWLLRKRSAECGRQALKNGFCIGWDSSCLTKRKKLLLSRVFEASVFNQWKDDNNL